MDMLITLITLALQAPATLASTGVDASVAAVPTNACVSEDGSHPADAGGCRWDADAMGVPGGRSYWIDANGDFHYEDGAR